MNEEAAQQQALINGGSNPTQSKMDLDKMVHSASLDSKVADAVMGANGNNPKQTQQKVFKAVQDVMKNMPNKGNANPTSNITPFDVANGVIKQIGGNVPQIGATAGFTNRQ
jgi:hypothetical protein